MRHFRVALTMMSIFVLGLVLAASPIWAGRQGQEQTKKAKVELPPAVAKAVQVNCPGAEIDKMDMEKEAGIILYDIEFKADKGEIEVTEDGTVMDVTMIVAMKDIPESAAEAIQKAAPGAIIKQLEKSEVRAEVKKEGEKGTIVKFDSPRYIYEAELEKGEQKGEIQVAPDGKVVEGPKWNKEEAEEEEMGEKAEAEEKEEAEETEEATPAAVDLKILPPSVLNAFKMAYPNAVIKGTSKETEKGVTYFEVESVDGKMNRDLLYSADGKAVEVEEVIVPGALPPAVLHALAKAYPGYEIFKAEDLVKGGQKYFELQIQVKDKKIGVTIDPSGKIIE